MTADLATRLMNELLWNGLLILGPFIAITMLVGLLVSVLQVVTQLQEASLSFVPKLVTAVVVLVACGPWMLKRLVAFAVRLITDIPNLG